MENIREKLTYREWKSAKETRNSDIKYLLIIAGLITALVIFKKQTDEPNPRITGTGFYQMERSTH